MQKILYELEIIMDTEVTPALASHGGGGEITKLKMVSFILNLKVAVKGAPGARMTMKMELKRCLKKRFQRLKRLLM